MFENGINPCIIVAWSLFPLHSTTVSRQYRLLTLQILALIDWFKPYDTKYVISEAFFPATTEKI